MTQTQTNFGQKLLIVCVVFIITLGALKWHRVVPAGIAFRHLDLPYMAFVDSESYFNMASGNTAIVNSPFTKRWLYPFLAKNLSAATNLPVPTSFMLLNLLSFALLAYCLVSCLDKLTGHPWLVVPMLMTPYMIEAVGFGYLPDLFHVALISLFFLLLLHDKIILSLVVLMIAFIARENTLLICIFGALIGFLNRQKLFMWGCLAVLGLGMAAGSQLAKMGLPNIHKMPDPIYLAGKVPYNFLANIGGVCIWSDLRTNVGIPTKTWDVPPVLQKLTADKKIGYFVDWKKPIATLITLLTVFGIAPLFFHRLWKTRPKPAPEMPLGIQLALVYGLVSYFLGTSLGDWVERLVGYGWPAFWIALPYLVRKAEWKFSRTDLFWLIGAYFLVCWLPPILGHSRWTPNFIALLVLIPYFFVFRRLKKFEPAAVLDKNPTCAATPLAR